MYQPFCFLLFDLHQQPFLIQVEKYAHPAIPS
jgi:hypothetical protein